MNYQVKLIINDKKQVTKLYWLHLIFNLLNIKLQNKKNEDIKKQIF
jgi:hypothetical protein